MNESGRNTKPRRFIGLDADLGPARQLSAADTEWLVEQVVDRMVEPAKKATIRRFKVRTLALAALAVATSTAAATIVHQTYLKHDVARTPEPIVSLQPTQKAAKVRVSQQPPSAPISETAPSAEVPAPSSSVSLSAASPSNSTTPARGATLADRLSAANDLRRQSQWQAAEAAYRAVAARDPGASEATVARLAAAELRLEYLGDPGGALRLYQSVPRSSALGVEALSGVSRACRALGDRTAEAAALRSLLETYPTSLQADRSRERLKQLSSESAAP
jgi:hypothetical protein